MKRLLLFLCLPLVLGGCAEESDTVVEDTRVALQPGLSVATDAPSASRSIVNGIGTGGSGITSVGIYVARTLDNATYPGTPENGVTFTAQTDLNKAWLPADGSTVYLSKEEVRLYTWSPATATIDKSGAQPVIPIVVPASQTFNGNNGWECDGTDYLYGSGGQGVGNKTPIIAHNRAASPDIYLQHALTQVVFSMQYLSPDAAGKRDDQYVKSITLTDVGGTRFLTSTGTAGMQTGDGALSGLTGTQVLTFTPQAGTDQGIGVLQANTVAYGLVAPTAISSGVTLTLTLASKTGTNLTTHKLENVNVNWQRGYRYIYNLKFNNSLTLETASVPWTNITTGDIEAGERGIISNEDLLTFAKLWAENGDKDYSIYEKYGWEENGQFVIKLCNSLVIPAVNTEDVDNVWIPIGTKDHPLTLPFDGQGNTVTLQFSNNIPMVIRNREYAGFIGYARTTISNLRIKTDIVGTTVEDGNRIEMPDAIYAGGLAGRVEGDIVNCSVDLAGTSILNTNAAATESMYIGGLVGHCTGNIYNSAVYSSTVSAQAGTAKVYFANATDGSCAGGLAGKVERAVKNCYTHLEGVGHSDTGGGTAVGNFSGGWLVGDRTQATFKNSFYLTGGAIMGGWTPESAVSGITFQNDFTGLCTLLNAGATAAGSGWKQWQEVMASDGVTIEKVTLK